MRLLASSLWHFDPEVPKETGAKGCCDAVNRGAAYMDGRVFVGTLDGRLIAIDAETGHLIWSTVTVDQNQNYTITGAPRVANNKVFHWQRRRRIRRTRLYIRLRR